MQLQLVFAALIGKIITFLVGVFFIKKLATAYKLLLLQVLVALLFESYGFYLGYVKLHNNIWIFNYYLLLEAWLLSIICLAFINNVLLKKITFPILFAVSGIWLYEIMTDSIHVLANKFFIAYGLLLIVLNIAILFNRAFSKESLFKNPVFWVAISSILYFSCVIPYKGMENYLISRSLKLAESLFDILQVVNIIRYPLIALSFYLYARQQKMQQANEILTD